MRPKRGLSPAQSNQLGRALMALAAGQMLVAGVRLLRTRSVLALPGTLLLAAASGLLFWAGATMATNRFDDADFGDEDPPAA